MCERCRCNDVTTNSAYCRDYRPPSATPPAPAPAPDAGGGAAFVKAVDALIEASYGIPADVAAAHARVLALHAAACDAARAAVLRMYAEACARADAAEDAAGIGRALMEWIAKFRPDDYWDECPTEVLTRLLDDHDALGDAAAAALTPADDAGAGDAS